MPLQKKKNDTHIFEKGISIDAPVQKNGKQENFISEIANGKNALGCKVILWFGRSTKLKTDHT